MGFWGKASKITGFTMLGVGLAGTAGFGALLGVGANATYSVADEGEAGIGSLNYGKVKVNGKWIDSETTKLSYSDFVKLAKDQKKLADAMPDGQAKDEALKMPNAVQVRFHF